VDISQLIGFLVSFLAFIYLMYRKIRDERHRPSQPEGQDQLHEYLKSIDEEEEDEEEAPVLPPPPPVRKPKPTPAQTTYHAATDVDAYKRKNAFESRTVEPSLQKKMSGSINARYSESSAYHAIEKAMPSRALRLLNGLKSKKDMVILHEIIKLPRSRRNALPRG